MWGDGLKKRFWSPKVKAIVIIAVVLAVLTMVAAAVSSGTPFGENLVGTLLSPFRAGVAAIDRQAERYYNYLFSYESLQAENAELQKKVLSMEEDVRSAETYQRENERLRTLLKLTEEHEDYVLVSAYITSWNSSEYKSAFTIGTEYRRTWLNRRGLEWRNLATVGQLTSLRSELVQPIDVARRWMSAAFADGRQRTDELFVGGDAVARLRNRAGSFGVEIRRRFTTDAELFHQKGNPSFINHCYQFLSFGL